MPRFALEARDARIDITFDDGGMNLLSSAALHELDATITDVLMNVEISDVNLITFRSARPVLFAAGADMAEMQRFTAVEAWKFARRGQEVFDRIARLPCTTVAIIDGDCFGGALDLALSFDLRFATPRARFAHPGARLGIVTGFGGTSRWRNAISRPAANQLLLANRVFTAADALEDGLVDRVAEAHDEDLAKLSSVEHRRGRMVKELTIAGRRAGPRDLLLFSRQLRQIYFAP